LQRIVDPPVRVLIRDGCVDEANMRRCRLTAADLDAILRQHGYEDAAQVRLAVYETRGTVSVLPADA
jgi:uncharacterized membrane protein YcaP (DUF421 family)